MKTKQTKVTQSRTNKKVKEDKPEEKEAEEQSRFQLTTRRRGTQILTELTVRISTFRPISVFLRFLRDTSYFPQRLLGLYGFLIKTTSTSTTTTTTTTITTTATTTETEQSPPPSKKKNINNFVVENEEEKEGGRGGGGRGGTAEETVTGAKKPKNSSKKLHQSNTRTNETRTFADYGRRKQAFKILDLRNKQKMEMIKTINAKRLSCSTTSKQKSKKKLRRV